MMGKIFIIQLIISFFIGGGFMALLSFLAEKANEKLAGIILAFPSSMAIGFFFLAWTNSSKEVASLIPATLIPLGLTVFFPVIYISAAYFYNNLKLAKITSIILTFMTSCFFWLFVAIPIALFRLSNLIIGILGYLFFTVMAYYILHKKFTSRGKTPSLKYSLLQKIGRAIFVGSIMSFVVFLGKRLNPFWGCVFTIFPAAFSSTLIIFHWYYNPLRLSQLIRKIPIGSLSFLVYALMVMITFPLIGFIGGTIIAYLGSLITSILIAKISVRDK